MRGTDSLHLLLSALTAAALLVAAAGGAPFAAGPTAPASSPAVHVTPPAVPTSDAPDAAAAFAAEFERAAAYNRRFGPGVADVNATCEASFNRRIGGGRYAVAACAGSVVRAVGGDRVRRGFVDPPAVYRVGDGGFRRVPLDEVRTPRSSPLAPFDTVDARTGNLSFARGVAVVNLADAAANVSVRLTRVAVDESAAGGVPAGGNATVFAGTYSIGPTDALAFRRVVEREGTYRLTVEFAGGPAATYEWVADAGDPYAAYDAIAYRTPAGALDVGRYPPL